MPRGKSMLATAPALPTPGSANELAPGQVDAPSPRGSSSSFRSARPPTPSCGRRSVCSLTRFLPATSRKCSIAPSTPCSPRWRSGSSRATAKPRPARAARAVRSRTIPAAVRRAVWARDAGQCTFTSTEGRRCATRRALEFDHVVPFARGGEATLAGLRLRCRAHNQFEAERTFGEAFMRGKRERARGAQAEAMTVHDREVESALRGLGCRAEEARQGAAHAAAMGAERIEERLREALRFVGRRAAGRVGAHAPPRREQLCPTPALQLGSSSRAALPPLSPGGIGAGRPGRRPSPGPSGVPARRPVRPPNRPRSGPAKRSCATCTNVYNGPRNRCGSGFRGPAGRIPEGRPGSPAVQRSSRKEIVPHAPAADFERQGKDEGPRARGPADREAVRQGGHHASRRGAGKHRHRRDLDRLARSRPRARHRRRAARPRDRDLRPRVLGQDHPGAHDHRPRAEGRRQRRLHRCRARARPGLRAEAGRQPR